MLLAFADSHRSQIALELIAELILSQQPRLFVHAGDNYPDFQWLQKKTKVPGYGVRGNCDFGNMPEAREELIFCYQNKKILLTHGHKEGAKYSYRALLRRAEKLGAEAVIFGHSHVPLLQEKAGIWLINPGSIPLPRGGSRPSYAKISLEQGKLKAELIEV